MDQQQERVQADLRGLLEGEVHCADIFTQMYASDASIFQVRPLGIVRPRGTDDVVACVKYAQENGIPLHARGAGTGLAGESLGTGLVVDFSHSMRRVLEVGDDFVRVQPGVVLGQLNRQLRSVNRMFGPDPATAAVTTMGSVLAINGSGSHWLQHGSAGDHIQSMQVVLADGEKLTVGREALSTTPQQRTSRRHELVSILSDLLERQSDIISEHRPRSLVNRCGYNVFDVLDDGHLDLAKLLVGSEGTLALTTEARLRIQPLPASRGVVLLFFDRLDSAAIAAQEVPSLGASACDLMDRRLLTIARETNVHYDLLIPPETEAMLLVEFQGDSLAEVRDGLNEVISRLQRRRRLAFDVRIALEADEVELFWRLAERVVPTLYRLTGSQRPLPFVEDIAVPPGSLAEFLREVQNVLKHHQVTASVFAHAGHGQLHIRPFIDLADPEQVQLLQRLADDLYEKVFECRGTISGEHGAGFSRSSFVRRQYGPVYDVFREVKRIFDPRNILNPGKVVGEDLDLAVKNYRPVAPMPLEDQNLTSADQGTIADNAEPPPLFDLQLPWEVNDVLHATRECNGCGRCRTQLPAERMCPIFRFAPAEEASPRAKANLLRAVLTGRLDASQLEGDELKQIADLCVNCHQCRLECPASVDIPKLMLEVKAQYVATNGLQPAYWLTANIDRLSAFGSKFYLMANWAIGNTFMRWVMEKTLGLAQGRKLPRFHRRGGFMQLAKRRRWTRPVKSDGRKVLYFVDTYANYHDVQLAEAFVRVLQHNGVAVYVAPGQRASGMSMISQGALEPARKLAQRNVALLADAVRQGYQIVTTEPTAALCLTHEYVNLLGDGDAASVAENTSEACNYLWRMHQQGVLELDLKPVNATFGYHMPCHLKAMEVGSPGENLLRLIPGLVVEPIDKGCSGMAGTYGLLRTNYRNSLRAGWGVISALRKQRLQFGTTECSSCKMQMEQGTSKPTIHPLKVLALAYGIMPELEPLLNTRSEELIVT